MNQRKRTSIRFPRSGESRQRWSARTSRGRGVRERVDKAGALIDVIEHGVRRILGGFHDVARSVTC